MILFFTGVTILAAFFPVWVQDESSGKINRKEGYSGINLLFSLPVDASKADPAVADAYLKELEES